MAACGSLHPIFDNPLPETPTAAATSTTEAPWNQNHSFTDIFRDLYFQDHDNNNSSTPPLPPISKRLSTSKSSSERNRRLNSRRYSFSNIYDHDETTSTDFPAKPVQDEEEEEEEEDRELTESNRRNLSRRYRRSKSFGGTFPPPISCLGRNGKPGMCFKYFRSDGRFILKEVRIPNQDFLHVKREDGRLQLRLVHSESEDEDDDEDDDHDHDHDHDPKVVEIGVGITEETNKNE